MSKGPLSGIRVIDLSQFLPGPFAAQMFADMGADVLKIEPPAGDPMAALNPFTNARRPAPFHAVLNAGKRLIALDLKSAEGRQAFKALVSSADVLIESYRPGVMARLGFDYAALSRLNPRLIHCALSGYGQTGPLSQRSGHDINYVASSGGLNVSGSETMPQPAFPPVADYGGAMQAMIAIQGALLGRAAHGRGCYLDVAMADTMLSWQAFGLVQQDLSETSGAPAPGRRQGLLNGGAACYQIYRTADAKHVSLGAIETVFWENFCDAVGRPDWRDRQAEPLPQTALIAELAGLFETHERAHWDATLGDVDCCYHPVLNYSELARWPQVENRKILDRDAESGRFQGLRFAAWQDGGPPEKRTKLRRVTPDEALEAWGGDDANSS